MKQNKFWSIITWIIIVIWSVALIWIILTTFNQNLTNNTYNTQIISDLENIKNWLISYSKEKNIYPEPKWNLRFYDTDWAYEHNYDKCFWVSWFLEKVLLAENINTLDPKTWQFYGYWKTRSSNNFEISWIIYENNSYQSVIYGNYEKKENQVKNLIKEYNWPNFVFDKSTQNFPYNPNNKKLTAKILSYEWNLKINDKILSKKEILEYEIKEWDKISVLTWGTAEIYYSDWSSSTLGNTLTNSEIILANMSFIEDNSLFTSIKIALNIWSLWTKASKLSEKSDFEVYTTNTIAWVRWTEFWITVNKIWTELLVKNWKVETKKIIAKNNINWNIKWSLYDIKNSKLLTPLDYAKSKNIKNISTYFEDINKWTISVDNDWKSYIEVKPWEKSKWIIFDGEKIIKIY